MDLIEDKEFVDEYEKWLDEFGWAPEAPLGLEEIGHINQMGEMYEIEKKNLRAEAEY